MIPDANRKALHCLDPGNDHGHCLDSGPRELAVRGRAVSLDDAGGTGKVALLALDVTVRVRLQRRGRVQRHIARLAPE